MNRIYCQTPLAAVLLLAASVVLTGCPKSSPATDSVSLDARDSPYLPYLRQIQARISERWRPPQATRVGDQAVKAVVLFKLGRDGSFLQEPVVEKGSGNAVYDKAALRAVVEASPFPPLPPEYKAPSLTVHFGFEFKRPSP